MRCLALSDLPSPPPGKTGWPWTVESEQLPDTMPDGFPWPRASIVTPSYNQGQFIEQTIRSVLLQGYPNLEYIVIDGGSSDGSVDVIRRYEPCLTYWISEPDEGQSDALDKGFQRATGSIVAWINADDWYLPGVLPERVMALVRNPEVVLAYGDCHRVDEAGERINTWKTRPVTASDLLLDGNQIPQQSTLIRAAALDAIRGIDRHLHYVMDYALWLRLSLVGEWMYVSGPVASFRKHTSSKGGSAGYSFLVEQLGFLSEWPGLDQVLTAAERAEMFRRQHIMAALYAIFEGKEAEAASHISTAFADGVWPYGSADELAERIVRFGGMAGHTMRDSWERCETLGRVLHSVEPAGMRRKLWRRVASQYHVLWALRSRREGDLSAAKMYLLRGIAYDLRCLQDRRVLYAGAVSVLGPGRVKRLKRLVGHGGVDRAG